MAIGTGMLDLFGSRLSDRQAFFDISLLPMNLSNGRNIGELPGLFLYKSPKKADVSRQSDILIVLFYVDNIQVTESRMNTWGDILAEAYFTARGSFTMGMSAAVKKLSAYLDKEKKEPIMPVICMNAVVLRGRSLMIAHAGPVHSTVISSDHVQNFSDESCLPLQLQQNDLSFFTVDVHSEDIILLCPRVPNDWTNAAIMEVTGDSPLNAIRFLLDRSGGDLRAAVIQLKRGKGEVIFRSKKNITANVQSEKPESEKDSKTGRKSPGAFSSQKDFEQEQFAAERPLFRQRKSAELFNENTSENKKTESEELKEQAETEKPVENETNENSLTGERELPGAEALPYDFTEDPSAKKEKEIPEGAKKRRVKPQNSSKEQNKKSENGTKRKGNFNFKRFLLILVCGLLIPIIVVSALFFIYSGRSKDQLHREYLSLGITAAQKALTENNKANKEALWNEVLNYVSQSMNYGNSPAAADLRKQAMNEIDRINGGIATIYNYANQSKLPQGLNITEISSSGQYTYALDSASGSVMRFTASGSGLALDNNFTCSPGIYSEFGEENKTVQVGPLIDFILLPSGNPHSFVLTAIDANANILYCSGFKNNEAARLKTPETRKLEIKSITFSNNAMYILDTQASSVWEYLYSSFDGFIYEPSNYYGSYSPYLSDIIDFTMYKEYAFFVKENGTLLICDYTGYRPDCRSVTEIESSDGTAFIGLANHQFKKIMTNSSPDNSIYIMDAKMQSVLNISAKANFIRYIVPNRSFDEISQYSNATGFGITGQNRLLWGYQNDLYIGNMP